MYIQTAIPIPHNCKTKIYIDATQEEKKEYNTNSKGSHQTTREPKRREGKKKMYKTINKMAERTCMPACSVVSDL